MRVGVVGYGPFGKFLTQLLIDCPQHQHHLVRAIDRHSIEYVAEIDNVKKESDARLELFTLDNIESFAAGLDTIVMAVSISSLATVLDSIPSQIFHNRLVVDVCSVKMHARDTMVRLLPSSADILCTHPMFGPRSASTVNALSGKNFMHNRIRISDNERCDAFMNIWTHYSCNVIDMSCEEHDQHTAKSQFVTHFIARSLNLYSLGPTPIDTPSYKNLSSLTTGLCEDSADMYQAMYKYNPYAAAELERIKESISVVERQLH